VGEKHRPRQMRFIGVLFDSICVHRFRFLDLPPGAWKVHWVETNQPKGCTSLSVVFLQLLEEMGNGVDDSAMVEFVD
jgi:hypothetical protein